MRRASQRDVCLFTHMGQALLSIQVLEETLTVSLVLKVDVTYPLKKSAKQIKEIIDKRMKRTLGQSISKAVDTNAYSDSILKELHKFCVERNWLVHRSIEEFYNKPSYFVERSLAVAREAVRLKQVFEQDLISFGDQNGLQTDWLKEALEQSSLT